MVAVVMGGVDLLTGMFLSFPPIQATVHSVLSQSSTYSRLNEAHHIPDHTVRGVCDKDASLSPPGGELQQHILTLL